MRDITVIMSPKVSFDRFAGCLLGQCLGDALGHPVEGCPPEICLEYLNCQIGPLWNGNPSPEASLIGQYTDDSQLARELLVSIVACGNFDPSDYAQRLLSLFSTNRIVGRGVACDAAANRLASGVPWEDAGEPAPSAGNGTAMRAAPAGMMYYHQPHEMVRVAREQGWITHRDIRCDAGSVAMAAAVALALQGESRPVEFVNGVSRHVTPIDISFGGLIADLPAMLEEDFREVVDWAARAGMEPGYHSGWPGISPFVVGTVLWSFYCFLKTPDDYFSSIWASIAVGGDVDTTAAMTGAISEAYNGAAALPPHLVGMLHDRGTWRHEDLRKLCAEAYENLHTCPDGI